MAVFTSRITGRAAIERLIEDVLRLHEDGRTRDGRRQSGGLERVRAALKDSSLFSPDVVRNYRRRQRLPDGLVQGAALALLGDSSLTEFSPEGLGEHDEADAQGQIQEALQVAHDLKAALVGLKFESVVYECRLLPPKKGAESPSALDGVVTTTYRYPQVSRRYGSHFFHINSLTDFGGARWAPSDDDKPPEISPAKGSGVRLTDSFAHVRSTESYARPPGEQWRSVAPDNAKLSRQVEMIHEFEIDQTTGPDTTITIERRVPRAFSLVPGERSSIQYAAFKVTRPTSSLTLSLELPDGFFKDDKEAGVNVHAWGPWSMDIAAFDYNRISRHIVGSQAKPLGPGNRWVWKSGGPVMMGMAYGLTYDTRLTQYFHDSLNKS